MKNPWVVLGIITVVLFGGAIWYSTSVGAKSNEGIVAPETHVKGNPDATVTLTEYSDFQCPACGAFEPVVQDVLNQYGDRIRFEYKHYPLPIHPFAVQAAIAAEAAGQQGKFFEYHDALFAGQQTWAASQTPQVFFLQYAEELGLDMATFKRHTKSSLLRDSVKASQKEAQDMGLTGTPTFFLNGERLEMESYEDFVAQIVAAVDPTAAAMMSASSTSSTSAPAAPGDIKFGL